MACFTSFWLVHTGTMKARRDNATVTVPIEVQAYPIPSAYRRCMFSVLCRSSRHADVNLLLYGYHIIMALHMVAGTCYFNVVAPK